MRALSSLLLLCVLATLLHAEEKVTGTVDYQPLDDPKKVPPEYHLDAHQFPYEMKLKQSHEKEGYDVYTVTFPSAVTTKYPENNTVHCEWYQPRGKGPFPATVVLDILDGSQKLTKVQSTILVQKGIACLTVQMAYYGPRRPANSKIRLIMPDIDHTLGAIRQTVLDNRRAAAWIASRPEVDENRLGMVGTSLGSFMGSLSAEMEPRFTKVAIILGGGGVVDAYYDHPQGDSVRKLWESTGGTKEKLEQMIAIADPITRAENLKDREVIMFAAKNDEIVPPTMCNRMWEALGKPKIIWYEAGHYTAILFITNALQHTIDHFKK
ncbi:MAG TPA: alpha/beta hydrolase family protein [Gemmatales bacterium]|nr:alpha/beta hydrolase family protein [Gemmatales bacterium]